MNENKLLESGYGQISGGSLAGSWYKDGKYFRVDDGNLTEIDANGEIVNGATPIVPITEQETAAAAAEAEQARIRDLLENNSPSELHALAEVVFAELSDADRELHKDSVKEVAEDLKDGDVDTSARLNAEFIAKFAS